jgi:hypothetical protein
MGIVIHALFAGEAKHCVFEARDVMNALWPGEAKRFLLGDHTFFVALGLDFFDMPLMALAATTCTR